MEGKFVGGKLHWLSTKMKTISSLDMKSEVFGTIELPDQSDEDRCYVMLGTLGGRLCLTYDFYRDPKKITFDVWVMKESWEKLLTIHLLHEPRDNVDARSAQVIGEAANGEILIAFRKSLLVYCPRDDVIRQFLQSTSLR